MAIENVPWRCSALLLLPCLIIVTLALGSCYLLYQFPRAAATQYHRLGGLHNRNVLSHGPGSQKSETKVSAGLVPSEGCEGAPVPGLSGRREPGVGGWKVLT